MRAAALMCIGWALVRAAWTGYNAAVQTGVGVFFKGLFYYGSHDGTANVDSTSFSYAVLFGLAGVLLLRGSVWSRGFVLALAATDAYGRLRSLTGALLDPSQVDWFTGRLEGQLRLATMVIGVVLFVVLLVLLRSHLRAGAAAGPSIGTGPSVGAAPPVGTAPWAGPSYPAPGGYQPTQPVQLPQPVQGGWPAPGYPGGVPAQPNPYAGPVPGGYGQPQPPVGGYQPPPPPGPGGPV
ncbi:hypothetical protein GCM10009738_50460 [Kitasatospora viridis]